MKKIRIEGMMCKHCEANVTRVLSALDSGVRVDLEAGCAYVAPETDDGEIRRLITEAGYTVKEIE